MCILHGKSSEEVKLSIDDKWAKMVSCQEQKHKLFEQPTSPQVFLKRIDDSLTPI